MAKKLDPALLQEELKKFKLLSEYTFYTEKDDTQKTDDLILGSGLAEDGDNTETPEDPAAAPADPNADPAADPNADPAAGGDDNLFGTDDPADAAQGPADPAAAAPAPAAPAPAPMPAPAPPTDDVEVDVTQLVQGNEEATQAASDASHKASELLAKFGELEQKVAAMDMMTSKIDNLEKEIIKRNPTPVEKLEMRSLDSFPFNIKINDYWKDEIEGYDPRGGNGEKEYVLTPDDVDADYSDAAVKKSLDGDDYEEEEIY